MKKKTNLQTVEGEPRSRRTGPAKEKTQLTVRLDSELMGKIYGQIKKDNTRITDWIERGLNLALGEARQGVPEWTKQVRFMVANATKEQERLLRGLLIAMVEAEVAPAKNKWDAQF